MPLSRSLHREFLLGCDEMLAGSLMPLSKSLNLQPLLQKVVMPPAADAAVTVIGILIAVVTVIGFSNVAVTVIGALSAVVMLVCALSAAVTTIGVLSAAVTVIGALSTAVMLVGVLSAAVTMIGVLDAAVTVIVFLTAVVVIGILDAVVTATGVLTLPWKELQALQEFPHQRLLPLLVRARPCQSLQLPMQPYRVLLRPDQMES